MKKRISKLQGSIKDLLKNLMTNREILFQYYHWDSKLFRAIQDHIWHAKPCVLINKPQDEDGHPLQVTVCRGTGACVRFIDAHCYGMQFHANNNSYEVDYFNLTVEVVFDCGNDQTIDKEYQFNVPYDLEDNFTEEKFNLWVNEIHEKIKKENEEIDIPNLKRLIKLYPEEAEKLTNLNKLNWR